MAYRHRYHAPRSEKNELNQAGPISAPLKMLLPIILELLQK